MTETINEKTTTTKAEALQNMVFIPAGRFLMGSDKFYPEEKPVHHVTVDGFYMDTYEVTNKDYQKFVADTGYITVAERPLKPEDYPDARNKYHISQCLCFTGCCFFVYSFCHGVDLNIQSTQC